MASVCARCLRASPFSLRLRTLRRQWALFKSGNKAIGSTVVVRAVTTPVGKGSPRMALKALADGGGWRSFFCVKQIFFKSRFYKAYYFVS